MSGHPHVPWVVPEVPARVAPASDARCAQKWLELNVQIV